MTMRDKGAHWPVGTAALRDHTGKELNMDGAPKVPYRHPNFGQGKETTPNNILQLEDIHVEDVVDQVYRRRPSTPIYGRRIPLSIKPTKLNFSEFEGQDPES